MTELTQEVRNSLNRFAESDLRLVRKEGEIAISETNSGTLFLGYDSISREYVLCGPVGEMVRGKAGVVKPRLMREYKMVFDISVDAA